MSSDLAVSLHGCGASLKIHTFYDPVAAVFFSDMKHSFAQAPLTLLFPTVAEEIKLLMFPLFQAPIAERETPDLILLIHDLFV